MGNNESSRRYSSTDGAFDLFSLHGLNNNLKLGLNKELKLENTDAASPVDETRGASGTNPTLNHQSKENLNSEHTEASKDDNDITSLYDSESYEYSTAFSYVQTKNGSDEDFSGRKVRPLVRSNTLPIIHGHKNSSNNKSPERSESCLQAQETAHAQQQLGHTREAVVLNGEITHKGPSNSAPELLPPAKGIVVNSEPSSFSNDLDVGFKNRNWSFSQKSVSLREMQTTDTVPLSPHSHRLQQMEVIEASLQERLMTIREGISKGSPPLQLPDTEKECIPPPSHLKGKGENDNRKKKHVRMTNQARKTRRAEHNKAIIDDLCMIVSDLFIAEKNLFVHESEELHDTNASVIEMVRNFLSELPLRYALGVETPSEVLVHMRLLAVARSDSCRAAVHIVPLENINYSSSPSRDLKLVTISCKDTNGLLEYITKLLATGGSRVIDADVMMTNSDSIVLDRFVVEMKGRLRLDKLQQYVEMYLHENDSLIDESHGCSTFEDSNLTGNADVDSFCGAKKELSRSISFSCANYGQLYFQKPKDSHDVQRRESIKNEAEKAVPLSEFIASTGNLGMLHESRIRSSSTGGRLFRQSFLGSNYALCPEGTQTSGDQAFEASPKARRRRQGADGGPQSNEINVESETAAVGLLGSLLNEDYQRNIPNIPLARIKLLETLGTGRISTIYRAIWEHDVEEGKDRFKIVALKVAVLSTPGGEDHLKESKREADIATSLKHQNVCELLGVAYDSGCYCLAYEFCSGGCLMSLLSDTSRCYDYLPIALDIANGMAYLHSRNVIHRDLKPSNILLTQDNRAKVADFGMSVANTGQELTAETGTYRWMAPEVIRHESYSSNADVYSFGIVLWQLITREVPFATLTPIQTAYAVAEGHRPIVPKSTPAQLKKIIDACLDGDSERRPSFTYITMALADYAKMAFSPANVGAQTVQIANDMLANVPGNSTVNVDFSAPMQNSRPRRNAIPSNNSPHQTQSICGPSLFLNQGPGSFGSNLGLEI